MSEQQHLIRRVAEALRQVGWNASQELRRTKGQPLGDPCLFNELPDHQQAAYLAVAKWHIEALDAKAKGDA